MALRGVCCRTTTASRPGSRPTLGSGGTSIRLPSIPITGRSRLSPASNPPWLRSRPWALCSRGHGRRPRHHLHKVLPRFATHRLRVGSVWRRQDLSSRRRGHLLRHCRRQRVEPARKRHSVRPTATDRWGSLNSITNFYSTQEISLPRRRAAASSLTPIRRASPHSSPGRRRNRSHLHEFQVSIRLPVQFFRAAAVTRPDNTDDGVCWRAFAPTATFS